MHPIAYTEANPFDTPHQVQLRWDRENKEKMLAGPFKAPTPMNGCYPTPYSLCSSVLLIHQRWIMK
jgi:hypothetical protein